MSFRSLLLFLTAKYVLFPLNAIPYVNLPVVQVGLLVNTDVLPLPDASAVCVPVPSSILHRAIGPSNRLDGVIDGDGVTDGVCVVVGDGVTVNVGVIDGVGVIDPVIDNVMLGVIVIDEVNVGVIVNVGVNVGV